MKLYGALASPYVARVVLFSRLKGLDLVPVMPEGGIKTEGFLAMNPMGRMPVLDTADGAIPESDVICEYLEDTHPGRGSLPTDAHSRAAARLLSRIHDLYVISQATVLFRNMNPAQRDAAAVETAREGLATGYRYLGHFLAADPYAAGARATLADCTLIPSFEILARTVFPMFGIDDPRKGGKFARWWQTVQSGPVTGPFLAEYGPAVDAFLKSLAAR
jgi:glutathione S-transferase